MRRNEINLIRQIVYDIDNKCIEMYFVSLIQMLILSILLWKFSIRIFGISNPYSENWPFILNWSIYISE